MEPQKPEHKYVEVNREEEWEVEDILDGQRQNNNHKSCQLKRIWHQAQLMGAKEQPRFFLVNW